LLDLSQLAQAIFISLKLMLFEMNPNVYESCRKLNPMRINVCDPVENMHHIFRDEYVQLEVIRHWFFLKH
jgi:hypothetical protein